MGVAPESQSPDAARSGSLRSGTNSGEGAAARDANQALGNVGGGSGWRPRALRDGSEPDPRFTLANERTFLAWIRTSLGLIAGAVALEAFAGDRIPPQIRTPLACTLLILAGLLSIFSFRRWIRLEQAMRHKQPLPIPKATVLLVVGVAVGAVLLVMGILTGPSE